jgi:hypothetical protein
LGFSPSSLTVKKKKYHSILLESVHFVIDWVPRLHHSLLKKEVPQDTVRNIQIDWGSLLHHYAVKKMKYSTIGYCKKV